MILQKLIQYLNTGNKSIIQSYKALRRLIGIQAIALPYICIFGGFIVADLPAEISVSAYYYSNMRDFLVGIIFAVSFFLITYKGYKKIDFLITFITGIAGFGIAVFPCYHNTAVYENVGIFQLPPELSNIFHLMSAGTFILLLAVNSMFLFTKTNKETPEKPKRIRNYIYISCGIIILLSLLGIILSLTFLTEEVWQHYRLILIFEIISLNAFGFSWLVKGQTLFRDKK